MQIFQVFLKMFYYSVTIMIFFKATSTQTKSAIIQYEDLILLDVATFLMEPQLRRLNLRLIKKMNYSLSGHPGGSCAS